ncbi:hypothetical protein [Burkholderia sp. BCC1047]|uniref:hypothetical protein n=1 Tax=Burkholderia sp. BCC1047 TaxID=2676299 RepID=UPI00158B1C9C|nr:hypothetical protein [Burkholderia sp. BCC1047]
MALADRSVSASRPEAWEAETESAQAIAAAAEDRRIGQFMDDPKQVMCIEQNGRSLAGGWATTGRRSGPEATARRGGRDLQGRLAGLQKRARIISWKSQKPFNHTSLVGKQKDFPSHRAPRPGARSHNRQLIDFPQAAPR